MMAESITQDFGYLLQSDDVFVDYLNAFLSLKIFPKRIKFDRTLNIFIEADASGEFGQSTFYDKLSLKEKVSFNRFLTSWCFEYRLPYFQRSSFYKEYKLCKKLIRENRVQSSKTNDYIPPSRFSQFSLGQSIQIKDEVQSIDEGSVQEQELWAQPEDTSPARSYCFSADMAKDRFSRAHSLSFLPPLKTEAKEITRRPATCVSWSFQHRNYDDSMQVGRPQEEEEDENKELFFEKEASSDEEFGESVFDFADMPENYEKEEQILSELRSISTKLQMSVQEMKEDYLGSIEKMKEFNKFLSNTKGKDLMSLWLQLETYKGFSIKEVSTPLEEREFRNKILREVETKFKRYLREDAPSKVLKVKGDSEAAVTFFIQMQRDILRRLVSYWIPRYLVHKEKSSSWESQASSDSGRDSECSLFPSISFVKTLPLLGNQVTEVPKETSFNSMVSFEDSSWHPCYFSTITFENTELGEESNNNIEKTDLLDTLLESDREAGYPFYNFLKRIGKEDASMSIELLTEIQEFNAMNRTADNRLVKLTAAWKLYNKYISTETQSNSKKVIIDSQEASRIQQILLEAKSLKRQFSPELFSTIQDTARDGLLELWELFTEEDLQIFVRTNIESVRSSGKVKKGLIQNRKISYSPNRWVKRYPGSTESERRHRLYTALSMAEEINASRQSDKTSVPEKVKKKKKKKKKKVKFKEEEEVEESELQSAKKKEVVNLADLVDNKVIIGYFRQYVQNQEGRETLNNLMLLLDINDYIGIPVIKTAQRQQHAKFIYNTYFDKSSRRSVDIPIEFFNDIQDECPASGVLTNTKDYLMKELNRSFRTFYKAFQAFSEASQENQSSNATGNDNNKKTNTDTKMSHAFSSKFKKIKRKGSARMQPSKEDKVSFVDEVKKCSGQMTDRMNAFRRYLLWQSETETFPRLEKDLLFYLEVQKFKDLLPFMDESSANKKTEVIIDVFIDSATPPWIQIDIGPEVTAKIVQKAQQTLPTLRRSTRDSKEPTIFDEAHSTVLKELLLYWTSFDLRYPDDTTINQIPDSKFERNKTRRYEQFLVAPNWKDTMMPKFKIPSAGKSKHEMIFSYGSGIGWKKAPPEKESIGNEELRRRPSSAYSDSNSY